MIKRRIHFEQVPLRIVKKIVEQQTEQKDAAEQSATARKKKLKTNPMDPMEAMMVTANG